MKRTAALISVLVAFAALAAAPALAGTMGVAWDPAADASGYKVYYGTSSGSYSQFKDVPGGSTTSTTLTGLDPCTRYYVAVKAYDNEGLESNDYSNEIVGLPRPVVSGVTPSSGEQGASMTLTITGESFDNGATVEFSGSGITVVSTNTDSCGQLTVGIEIAAGAPTGARNVEVMNPDRSYGALANAFTVTSNDAPTVSSATPAAGATDVAVTVDPVLVFSEAMDAATITTNNVQLREASGLVIPQAAGSPSLAADGVTVTVTPAEDLSYETGHYLWVRGGTNGALDANGGAMGSDWQQSPSWTTEKAPDTSGPSVTSTSPADGATGVPASVQPQVVFDEALDPASVTSSSVQLLDATGAPVAQASGSPQLSADGLTVTIVPASALAENALYKIRVAGGTNGVKDTAGNPMAAPYTQPNGFTTENLPPSNVSGTRRSDVK